MLTQRQWQWGVDQWAAYLSAQALPCMPRSKLLLLSLEQVQGERLAVKELADIAGLDPFLCLRLLREAESHRSRRLGHETTTALAAVMLLGSDAFRDLIVNSPETDEEIPGLAGCEARAHLAAQLAMRWGSARADISPQEIAMASLLAEMGELLLWSFAPELPQAAHKLLADGVVKRSVQAQEQACGFAFKQLTLKCATIWNLPLLLVQLIRGIDNARSNLSRLCVDTARHLASSSFDPALPSDLASAARLIPGASMHWLAEQMPGIDPAAIDDLVLQAQAIEHQGNGTEPH